VWSLKSFMRKYFPYYLLFYIPALLVSYLFTSESLLAHIVQWFFGFFMLLGWGVCTAMLAYNYPRGALAFMLAYFGVSVLLIYGLRSASFGSASYVFFDHVGGALSYRPLNMIYQTLLHFSIFQELWVILIIVGSCAVGFVCGVLYRQVRPNPYRPTFIGR